MIDPSTIRKDMPVIGSDGETLGQVDGVEGGAGAGQERRIKLKKNTSPDGHHHYVPLTDVARIDEHVHLSRPASEVRSGWMIAGAAAVGGAAVGVAAVGGAAAARLDATTTQTDRGHTDQGHTDPGPTDHGAREVHVENDRNWLPWILGALALFALLIFGLRSGDDADPVVAAPTVVPA